MTIETFKEYAKTRQALDSEEIRRFMDEMSNEARRSAVAPRLPAVLYGLR